MGKADKKQATTAINNETTRSLGQSNSGISDTQSRVNDLTGRADTERGNIISGYSGMATGGISDADKNALLYGKGADPRGISGSVSSGGGGGGSSSGGTGATGPSSGSPSYMDVYKSLVGANGGIDPSRLANIDSAANKLRDTSGNYGDVNQAIGSLLDSKNAYGATDTSVGGLQKFAATGGMNPGDKEGIDRQSLLDLESTGGYTDQQKGDLRARSNSGVASTYANMKAGLDRNKLVSGNVGPGWSETGLRLARQGAQDLGTNARNTEVGINQEVNANKMAAGSKLSDANLQLQGLKNQATLSGYTNSGNLANTKQAQIDAANENAGGMGLSRQSQIDAATAQAAGIDLGTAGQISNNQIAGAGGMETDALTRLQDATANRGISAGSASAQAALDAANQRFLIGEEDQNKTTGNAGLLSTYGTAPAELMADQNLLAGYRNNASDQQQGLINQRIAKGSMPGLGSDISTGLGIVGQVAGLGTGIGGAIGAIGKVGGAVSKGLGGSGAYSPYSPKIGLSYRAPQVRT